MLKMNTKKAMENAKKHFLIDFYQGQVGPFLRDGEAVGASYRGAKTTPYACGVKMAEGGVFACYYSQQREALREMLEETQEEAEKYTDDQVFKAYCHMAGKVYEKIKNAQK